VTSSDVRYAGVLGAVIVLGLLVELVVFVAAVVSGGRLVSGEVCSGGCGQSPGNCRCIAKGVR
jgi:hypothetical protein